MCLTIKNSLSILGEKNLIDNKVMNSPCSELQDITSVSFCFADEKELSNLAHPSCMQQGIQI